MIRKFFCIIFALIIPQFTLAKTESQIDWGEVFSDEAKRSFWFNFFNVIKLFLPYLIGLIILKIVLNIVLKKIKDWKKNKK
jgi:hypothetical protein